MNTEHILQFAIGIDDEGIRNSVMQHAEKEIIASLKQEVANKLFEPRYYGRSANPSSDPLSEYSKRIIVSLIDENKDSIIERAAQILAEKLLRSKAAKDMLGDLASSVGGASK